MIVGIVPARGGSKSISRKNLRPICGKPLVCHAIEAGLASQYIDRVIVSTDDQEIANVARTAGAHVPFVRPAQLAGDHVGPVPVLQHAVGWLEAHGERVNAVVTLQPTSPLRKASHIDAAIRKFIETGADTVVTVCAVEYSPYWMQRLDGDRLTPFMPEGMKTPRRQDLPPVFQLNGAVYVMRRDVVMEQGRVFGDDTRAIVMSREESIDIDEELDFALAELIASRMREQS